MRKTVVTPAGRVVGCAFSFLRKVHTHVYICASIWVRVPRGRQAAGNEARNYGEFVDGTGALDGDEEVASRLWERGRTTLGLLVLDADSIFWLAWLQTPGFLWSLK